MLAQATQPRSKVPSNASALSAEKGHKPQVVNLTERVVEAEIDTALALGKQRYRQFTRPAERQRLVRYVLERINGVYLVVHYPQRVKRHYAPVVAQKPEIRRLLREGVNKFASAC